MLSSPHDHASRQTSGLSPLVRLVLWDYERGSVPYDIALLLILLALLVVPGAFWADPLWARP